MICLKCAPIGSRRNAPLLTTMTNSLIYLNRSIMINKNIGRQMRRRGTFVNLDSCACSLYGITMERQKRRQDKYLISLNGTNRLKSRKDSRCNGRLIWRRSWSKRWFGSRCSSTERLKIWWRSARWPWTMHLAQISRWLWIIPAITINITS